MSTMERMVDASVEDLIDLIDLEEFDPDERDKGHGLQTFLMRLCHMDINPDDELDILTRLETKNPDYNIQDSHGRTALMHACIGRKLNVVQFVTSQCNDISPRDNDGNTVLVYAIKSEDCDIVEFLLGCDTMTFEILGAKNNLGLTALDFAKRTNNDSITRLIEESMPVHPTVKNLRKRHEKRQPRLPPASVPTASKPLALRSKGNIRDGTRVPFNHSKSLDTVDYLPDRKHERVFSADHMCYMCSQSDSESHLCVESDDEVTPRGCDVIQQSDVTPRDNDVTPRGDMYYTRNGSQKSLLPQITTRSAEQPRNIDRRKSRRDSISLPDLRDLTGILVSSGTTTPASKTGSRQTLTSQESLVECEEVFEIDSSYDKHNRLAQTLPVLLPHRTNKTDRALPVLSRARKKSNSTEDFTNRSLQF